MTVASANRSAMDSGRACSFIVAGPGLAGLEAPSRPAQALGDAVQQGWTFALLTLSL